MIRTATFADIPALTDNWKRCFGDGGDYVGFFMSRRFSPANTLVAVESERVVSQLFLLPGHLRLAGETYDADYLYAAATHPAYQGRGHMARLIEAAKAHTHARGGSFIALVPGKKGLYDYYARFGFSQLFTYQQRVFARAELEQIAVDHADVRAADAPEITALRNEVLSAGDAFLWSEPAVRYAVAEHEAFRGRAVCVYHEGQLCAWLLAARDGETAFVGECCALDGAFPLAARALLDCYDAAQFTLRIPATSDQIRPPVPSPLTPHTGMVCPLSADAATAITRGKNPYIGLILE